MAVRQLRSPEDKKLREEEALSKEHRAEIQAIEGELEALYGVRELSPGGVVHVVSAVRCEDGLLHVIAIGPHAPRSSSDFFVLQLSRAVADAVITSAEVVRSEPGLSLDFEGAWASALGAYRREALGKTRALECLVLTRSGDLPRKHALWRDSAHKIVLTDERAAPRVARNFPELELWIEREPSARRAIELLCERGFARISLEAGPATVAPLYAGGSDGVVDELWLSIADRAQLDARAVGKALPPDPVLFTGLSCAADTQRDEESGPWRFQRWVRG